MQTSDNTWVTPIKSWPDLGILKVRIEVNYESLDLRLQTNELFISFWSSDLPALLNLYRDLGHALDTLQPGLIEPLPDDDPNLVDAMKVVFAADEQRKAVK